MIVKMKIKNLVVTLLGLLILITTMGIFNKLFNFQKSDSPSLQAGAAQQDWNVYFSNLNGKIGSIVVDLGIKKIAPVKSQPNVVWISIKMNKPRPDGLSSSEESDLLGNLGEDLVKAIEAKHNVTHTGRITTDGHRDFYFYFADTTSYEKTILETMLKYPNYKYAYGTKVDKDWNDYLNILYPTPEQYQSIQNAKVVANLQKAGDILTKERAVEHWIYFKSEGDRKVFISKVENDGFNILKQDKVVTVKDYPYQLQIARFDKVDYASVDVYILPLWRLAQENNGLYDGWETVIVRD
jgi:uncharacterized protein (TIGR01619 family)